MRYCFNVDDRFSCVGEESGIYPVAGAGTFCLKTLRPGSLGRTYQASSSSFDLEGNDETGVNFHESLDVPIVSGDSLTLSLGCLLSSLTGKNRESFFVWTESGVVGSFRGLVLTLDGISSGSSSDSWISCNAGRSRPSRHGSLQLRYERVTRGKFGGLRDWIAASAAFDGQILSPLLLPWLLTTRKSSFTPVNASRQQST